MFASSPDPAQRAKRVDTIDRLVPGLYAWVVTVALPSASKGAPLGSRLSALLAAVALTSGALLVHVAPKTARSLGIWMFIAACLASWAIHPAAISAGRLDPVQGALGSLGWGLYALSWAGDQGRVSGARGGPTPATPAHGALRPLARVALVGTAFGVAAPMLLAWWVPGVERALFGHGTALAVGIALLALATRFVEVEGSQRAPRPGVTDRLSKTVATLLALALLLLAGAAFRLLR